MENKKTKWDLIISSEKNFFTLKLKELIKYRNLIKLFVKRDFVTFYKQTILGPLWFIIQPLINTIVFTIIFGKIAKISTDTIPPFIFYMSGTIAWGYFSTCLTATSNTFVQNAIIFGKVYFPRLCVPVANVIFSLVQFFLQFGIFLCFMFYFMFNGLQINFNYSLIFLPFLILQMALLGLGFGVLISSLTTKYRDLTFVVTFGVQVWMFVTPVVYPISIVPEKYQILVALNPMTSVVELFRYMTLGVSSIQPIHIVISIFITLVVFVLGVMSFNKTEKNFMDTV